MLKERYLALMILMIRHTFLAPEAGIVHPERANGPILIVQATQQASFLLQAVSRNPTVLGPWQVFPRIQKSPGGHLLSFLI